MVAIIDPKESRLEIQQALRKTKASPGNSQPKTEDSSSLERSPAGPSAALPLHNILNTQDDVVFASSSNMEASSPCEGVASRRSLREKDRRSLTSSPSETVVSDDGSALDNSKPDTRLSTANHGDIRVERREERFVEFVKKTFEVKKELARMTVQTTQLMARLAEMQAKLTETEEALVLLHLRNEHRQLLCS
jgi:hypothetical protein